MEPNFLAYLKLSTKVLASIGLAAAAILFLPASWVAALALAQIRKQYGALLGIAVLVAAAVLIIEGILFVSDWLRTRERLKPFEAYRTDQSFDMRWRWKWDRRGFVVDPRPFCLGCDLQLDGTSVTYGGMMDADTPTGEQHYLARSTTSRSTSNSPQAWRDPADTTPRSRARRSQWASSRDARTSRSHPSLPVSGRLWTG